MDKIYAGRASELGFGGCGGLLLVRL